MAFFGETVYRRILKKITEICLPVSKYKFKKKNYKQTHKMDYMLFASVIKTIF